MLWRRAGVAAAVAVLVAAPFFLVSLGAAPFDDPGEGMHAEIARELARSGDPFRLTLGGVRYVDKPPLLYALIAFATRVFGETEWAARLPSALAALVATGVTAWFGARLLGATGGLLAGGALLTSTGFFAYGRYVRPETLLVAALIGGFALALTGLTTDRRGPIVAGLLAFGVAGLAKDPVAVVAPPLAIGVALALARRSRPLGRWLPLEGVLGAVVIGLGWWIAVEIATRGFLWYTVVDNHLLNVARARRFPDEDVPLTAVEFLIVAGAGAAPWVLAAFAALVDLVRRRAWRRTDELPWVALAVWVVGVFGLTALSPFRLPHYGLPAYPMLALLAARAWRSPAARRLVPLHAALFAVVGLGALVLVTTGGSGTLAHILGATDVATRKSVASDADAVTPPWAAFVPLFAWVAGIALAAFIALLAVARARRPALGAGVVALAMLALLPAVAVALGLVSSYRAVRPLAIVVRDGWRTGDVLVHEGPLENSGALEWYSGRRPVLVDGRTSVLGFGATLPGAEAAFWDRERLRAGWTAPGRRVWLVTTREPDRTAAGELPGAVLLGATGGRRLYVNRTD